MTMKTLNKISSAIFNHLISLINYDDGYAKIDNTEGVFMPVNVEFLRHTTFLNQPARIFSISHIYYQNGDVCFDPDCEFLQLKENKNKIYPINITHPNCFIRAIWRDGDEWKYDKMELSDLVDFCNMWLLNIREQQELKIDFAKQIETFVNSVNSGEVQPRKCFKNFSKN